MELALVAIVIGVALVFDYINGFHDAANSIATVVSTRVLSPGKAVIWAAFFNFAAAFVFGTAVARTVGSGMIDINAVTTAVILAGLTGAIVWDLITWYYGLPTSSSHALIGGYAGAGIAKAGVGVLIPSGWTKTLVFIILAPAIGFGLGLAFMVAIFWIFRRVAPSRVDRWFRRLQLLSAALYSLGHGATTPRRRWASWPARSSPAATSPSSHPVLGRDDGLHRHLARDALRRLAHHPHHGIEITRLQPVGGFAAETAGAVSLFTATSMGVPVSTTHTITGAIVGVGATKRLSAVRWGIAGQIVWAWVLTIPASALIAAATFAFLDAAGMP